MTNECLDQANDYLTFRLSCGALPAVTDPLFLSIAWKNALVCRHHLGSDSG